MRDGIGLLDAAVGGAGVARFSGIAGRSLPDEGTLRSVLDDWTAARKAITAILPSHGRRPSAKVRLFLEHVAATLQKGG